MRTGKPAQMNGYCRVRFLAKSWREQGISPFLCRGVQSEKRTWGKCQLRHAYPRIYLYGIILRKSEKDSTLTERRGRCWKGKYFPRRFPVLADGSAIPYDSKGQLADALGEESFSWRSRTPFCLSVDARSTRPASRTKKKKKKILSTWRGDISR